MSENISVEKSVKQIIATIAARPIFGAQFELDQFMERAGSLGRWEKDVFYGRWERGWGCGCTLSVRMVMSTKRNQPTWSLECEVSWSSSGKALNDALCAVTLYREVIELAALLETQWGSETVGREFLGQ